MLNSAWIPGAVSHAVCILDCFSAALLYHCFVSDPPSPQSFSLMSQVRGVFKILRSNLGIERQFAAVTMITMVRIIV